MCIGSTLKGSTLKRRLQISRFRALIQFLLTPVPIQIGNVKLPTALGWKVFASFGPALLVGTFCWCHWKWISRAVFFLRLQGIKHTYWMVSWRQVYSYSWYKSHEILELVPESLTDMSSSKSFVNNQTTRVDLFTQAKLSIFSFISSISESYFTKYLADKPVDPYMYSDLRKNGYSFT